MGDERGALIAPTAPLAPMGHSPFQYLQGSRLGLRLDLGLGLGLPFPHTRGLTLLTSLGKNKFTGKHDYKFKSTAKLKEIK